MSICLDAALKEPKDPTPSIFKDKYTAESSRALALLNRKSASIKDEEDVEKNVGQVVHPSLKNVILQPTKTTHGSFHESVMNLKPMKLPGPGDLSGTNADNTPAKINEPNHSIPNRAIKPLSWYID